MGYRPNGSWQKEVVFNPPISHGVMLLHDNASALLCLSFTVSLRACPNVMRRISAACIEP